MPRDIILLHMCTINEDHMIYGSWDIRHNEELFGSYNHMLYKFLRCGAWQNYFSFWVIFCPFTHLTAQKIKIKKRKNTGDIIILPMCTKNYDQMMYGSWDTVHKRTDGQKDGQEKSNIEVGAHLKISCNYGNYFMIDSIILYPISFNV